MKQETIRALSQSMDGFSLPRYQEIPDVGLYLEQVTRYINDYIIPLGQCPLTNSMVSNYVKKGIIESPCKKLYHRDQIAHLLFIATAKSILSLDDLQKYIRLQQQTYAVEKAYNYFCQEFETMLQFVFNPREEGIRVVRDGNDEKTILKNIVITIAHKIYLEKYISAVTADAVRLKNQGEG